MEMAKGSAMVNKSLPTGMVRILLSPSFGAVFVLLIYIPRSF